MTPYAVASFLFPILAPFCIHPPQAFPASSLHSPVSGPLCTLSSAFVLSSLSSQLTPFPTDVFSLPVVGVNSLPQRSSDSWARLGPSNA